MKWEIVSQHGTHRSYHYSATNAAKQHQKNLAYRCGICGSPKRGWGQCAHGTHNRVCNAAHYNDKIIRIA